ncbi:MAG: N-acetylneuraminate synthase family protein [Armatimonadetes bacterium]|nr:N-acetylneuraminate synthase family protein [Armatimonadota bacterium]
MVIEIEKGHDSTVETIQQMAAQYGNSLETIVGGEVYDTLHLIGDVRELAAHLDYVANLPGVSRVWRISSSYKNIARVVSDGQKKAVHRARRVVEIRGLDGAVRRFGDGRHVFVVGPDSVQTEAQTFAQARMLARLADDLGIRDRLMLRAGAFKPRTRPTDFRGLGLEAITILDRVREETGLPYVTEVMDHTLVSVLAAHVDAFQIGTRNAQDFKLLEEVGRTGKPVVLKRGFGNDAEEWFNAAEYVANQGNLDILLCERGVRTMFARQGYNRFTPDFNVIRYAREKTILPVVFDPSHAAGDDRLVVENLLASLAYRPDGSLTEVIHHEDFRKEQLCDASQALAIEAFRHAVEAVLAFEETVIPHLRGADDYFERRTLGYSKAY